MNWRTIEQVLEEWFRGDQWDIHRIDGTLFADRVVELQDDDDETIGVNLTALAKHLADNLS